MAMISGAMQLSYGAMIIALAFSLAAWKLSILSRVCLVDHRGLLVRGVRASVHMPLCAHGRRFSEHTHEPTAQGFVPPFCQNTTPRGDYIDGRREKGYTHCG